MLNARLIGIAERFLFWVIALCGQGIADISGYGAGYWRLTWTPWSSCGLTVVLPWTHDGAIEF